MNVDRWFAIKFPEAYQKSLKTHHTWFIVGAWWLLALIPDLPLWFVPTFSFFFVFPFFLVWSIIFFFHSDPTASCHWRDEASIGFKASVYLNFTVAYIIPAVVSILLIS